MTIKHPRKKMWALVEPIQIPQWLRIRKRLQKFAGCQDPILSYFFGKILFCPIFGEMSYFILFLGHFAFNFGILWAFYHHYFTWEHPLKFFSLTSLGIKILSVHIILKSIFWPFSPLDTPCWVYKCRRKSIIFLRKILFLSLFFGGKSYFCPILRGCYVLFSYFFDLSYYLTPWIWYWPRKPHYVSINSINTEKLVATNPKRKSCLFMNDWICQAHGS